MFFENKRLFLEEKINNIFSYLPLNLKISVIKKIIMHINLYFIY